MIRGPAGGALAAAAAAVVLASAGAAAGRGSLPHLVLPHVGEPRLDSQLVQVADSARSHGSAAALATAKAQSIDVSHGRVRVIVQARPGQVVSAESAIEALGGEVEERADGLVQALVAPGALQQLASSGAVESVAPPAVPVAQSVDEAVQATGADVWHTAGYDGTGVKIAIIDLGFYGYQALLGSALPASVTPIDHCGGNLATAPVVRGHRARDGGRRARPSDGAGRAALSDLRRHRGRPGAGRAGRDHGRRERSSTIRSPGSTRAVATERAALERPTRSLQTLERMGFSG